MASDDPTLEVHLFGGFELTYDGQALTSIRQARLQSLLAYLILKCTIPIRRQHVAFVFWPDSTEAQAQNNLRKALFTLRRQQPILDNALHMNAGKIQWRPVIPHTVDVARFEQHLAAASQAKNKEIRSKQHAHLLAAIELYRGDLMPDCYEDWIAPERAHLHRSFLQALTDLSEIMESARDYRAAVQYAERLLNADPLQEKTYRRLMRLHALNSDRIAALRVYDICKKILSDELGVEPGVATQEAYVRLRALERSIIKPQGRRPLPARPTLVGRQEEWQRLLHVWELAAQGSAQFMVINGEPGIGKTRLVEELIHWVGQQGYAAVYGRAYAAEGHLPLEPIVEWLHAASMQPRLKALDDIWLDEIVRIAPNLQASRPDLSTPRPIANAWERRQLFEALARLVCTSPDPLLLVVDDLHWCDEDTLEWLHYVMRFAQHQRVCIVGTARPGELDTDHPVHILCRELELANQLLKFELSPLDQAETVSMARAIAGHPFSSSQATSLFRETEGNPLLIQETILGKWLAQPATGFAVAESPLSADGTPLPTKMKVVIELRLVRLKPPTRQLAALAATIGRSFTLAILKRTSGLDEDSLVESLDELWQRRIVRIREDDSYDFTHDKIREVAYRALTPVQQRLFHRKIAQVLEEYHADNLVDVSARIAAHFRLAGDATKAASYYLLSAYDLQFGLAYDETMASLRRGLAIIQRQPRSEENLRLEAAMNLTYGRILSARGGWGDPNAAVAFENACALCRTATDSEQLIYAQEWLALNYAFRETMPRALALAEQNLELAPKWGQYRELEHAHGLMGVVLFYSGELTASRHHFQQSANYAIGRPDPQHTLGVQLHFMAPMHGLVLWLLGYPDMANRYLQALEHQLANRFGDQVGYALRTIYCHWSGRAMHMQSNARDLHTLAEVYESAHYLWLARGFIAASTALLTGTGPVSSEDIALLRQSIATMQGQGNLTDVPYCLGLLAEVCALAGDPHAGMAALDEALALATSRKEEYWLAELHRLRGDMLAAANEIDSAASAYETAMAVAHAQQAKMLELRAAVSLGTQLQQQQRHQAAYDLLFPIYDWFTEGSDSMDLKAARSLIEMLTA